MKHPHLSDDHLIDGCLGEDALSVRDHQHLATCPACESRFAALTTVLADVAAVSDASADLAFSQDRLDRQRASILQRIGLEARPGRILAFPFGRDREPVLRTRPATRWVAVAAAAAFVVGLAAGHLANDLAGDGPGRSPVQQSVARARAAAPSTHTGVSTPLSDDEFLSQIEAASDSSGPAALQPLDSLTPHAWDVR